MFDPASLALSSLEGKIAVVTGSTQGLGEAIAHLFAERGVAGLLVTGRNERNGARVKAALDAKGVKTVFVPADLAVMEDRTDDADVAEVRATGVRVVDRVHVARAHSAGKGVDHSLAGEMERPDMDGDVL